MSKIYVVEDDLSLAEIYKKKLEEGGHSVQIVSDKDAVKKVNEDKPELVLLDILMPTNGLDILRDIKADPNVSGIPVLLLTNVADELSIERGLKYGADGYMLKSEMTPDQVLSQVNNTLEKNVPPQP
ncbi:response regulator [Candidatus Curtissbacteria bacterium]|nr:response regulator [Candidatus Curtissbacteria bacterium]